MRYDWISSVAIASVQWRTLVVSSLDLILATWFLFLGSSFPPWLWRRCFELRFASVVNTQSVACAKIVIPMGSCNGKHSEWEYEELRFWNKERERSYAIRDKVLIPCLADKSGRGGATGPSDCRDVARTSLMLCCAASDELTEVPVPTPSELFSTVLSSRSSAPKALPRKFQQEMVMETPSPVAYANPGNTSPVEVLASHQTSEWRWFLTCFWWVNPRLVSRIWALRNLHMDCSWEERFGRRPKRWGTCQTNFWHDILESSVWENLRWPISLLSGTRLKASIDAGCVLVPGHTPRAWLKRFAKGLERVAADSFRSWVKVTWEPV